jgi:hypothetical protein
VSCSIRKSLSSVMTRLYSDAVHGHEPAGGWMCVVGAGSRRAEPAGGWECVVGAGSRRAEPAGGWM